MTLSSTITLTDAAAHPWDVAVVGAGPAGGMAALLLARQGRRVLIIERSALPRDKACGCCLSSVGARLLVNNGLRHLVDQATTLSAVELRAPHRRLRLPTPRGRAIARPVLDTEIVRSAIQAGAHYLAPHAAHLLPADTGDTRSLQIGTHVLCAGLILACDGIRGTLLDDEPGCAWHIAPDAWMGAALTLDAPDPDFAEGVIHMHVGRAGYVGVVRLDPRRLHLAAALDPAACKHAGGPALLMESILNDTGAPALDLAAARVMGTPLLTRHRESLGGQRTLAIGDACGYVEPFTGEGMTWALTSAATLTTILPPDLSTWDAQLPARWTSLNHRHLKRHQRVCRALRWLLHRPALHRPGLALSGILPGVAASVVRMINRPAMAGARL